MIHLETQRLILRDYMPEDFQAYYRLKSDQQTMYYLQDIQLHSLEEAWEDFHGMLEDQASSARRFYFLHIELKSNHQQVGSVGYTVTDRMPLGKLAHGGYFTYPAFWNQGYTTEAMRRVLQFAFEEDGVYRLVTGCLAENRGSERVMQKCAMIKEAEHVDAVWHDGRLKTRVEYRLLQREWAEMHPAHGQGRGGCAIIEDREQREEEK